MKEWAELLDEDKKTTPYHSRAMFTGTIRFKKKSSISKSSTGPDGRNRRDFVTEGRRI